MTKTKILNTKPYNLEDRTFEFSKQLIRLCKQLPFDRINKRVIDQVIRSGTSIGTNYREANETDSKKEAKETLYWLLLLVEVNPDLEDRIMVLYNECTELMKILASIYGKAK